MTAIQKRTLKLLLVFFILASSAHAQKCATTYRDSLALLKDPNYLEKRYERIKKAVSDFKRKKGAQHPVVYIPTVVHVIHTSEDGIISDDPNIGNISEQQIMSQIEVLNQDYRKEFGTPGYNTNPLGADMELQFCLAKLDPEGNPTNGITRHFRPKTEYDASSDDVEIKNIVHWPADQYMNVYVVPSLSNNFLGYASFPDEPRALDGIVMANRFFGNRTGTSIDAFAFPYNRGRTMTHEVGHWLGLVHIWGDGNCAVDDGCDDTPDSDAGNYGCDTTHVSCNTPDMVRNYMDYSDDDCFNIFTLCQKNIVRNLFLDGFPDNRSSFLVSTLTGSINCEFDSDTSSNNKIGEEIRIGTIDQSEGRYLILNLEPGSFYQLQFYDLRGKKLSSEQLRSNAFGEIQFRLSGQRQGFYILKLVFPGGDTKRFKIYGPIRG